MSIVLYSMNTCECGDKSPAIGELRPQAKLFCGMRQQFVLIKQCPSLSMQICPASLVLCFNA